MTLTSIVILTFNCLPYTRACLDSIRKYTQVPYELIVVDNASTDGSPEFLQTQSDIHLILNTENKGYSHGNNQGMDLARGDTILLLNNDVIVTPGWLSGLLAHFESHPHLGIIGPRTNQISGIQKLNLDYHPWDMHAILEIAQQRQIHYAGQLTLTKRVAGFCMLLRHSVKRSIGNLDERFGTGNFEDDDYCLRAQMAEYQVGVAEDVFVHHFGSVSFLENQIDYREQMARNYRLYLKKWGKEDVYQYTSRPEIQSLLPHQFETVLEIRCRTGNLGYALRTRELGAHVVGIDSQPALCQQAENKLDRVICTELEAPELSCPEKSFDCLIFNDVLSRLKNPWAVLPHYLKYLKSDGLLISTFPNIKHVSVLKDLLAGQWNYDQAGLQDREYVRYLSIAEIQQLFDGQGLSIDFFQGISQIDDQQMLVQLEKELSTLGFEVDNLASNAAFYELIAVGGFKSSTQARQTRYMIAEPRIYWKGSYSKDMVTLLFPHLPISLQNQRDRNITIHALPPDQIRLDTGTLINIARIPPLSYPPGLEGLERLKVMDDIWASDHQTRDMLQEIGIPSHAIFILKPVHQDTEYLAGWCLQFKKRIRKILQKRELIRN